MKSGKGVLVFVMMVFFSSVFAGAARAESGNLLTSPGFENDAGAWQWLRWSKNWAPFEITGQRTRQGLGAVRFPLRSEGDKRNTVVWGAVQEITLQKPMPDCLSGYYFVDSWQRGAPKQYLQVVVIDLGRPPFASKGGKQIRYILSGVDQEPYAGMQNGRYVFVDPKRKTVPPTGKWTGFSLSPASDFKRLWGYVPPAGNDIRLLFEARFDGRGRQDRPVQADVYYDDLFFGSADSCGESGPRPAADP